MGIIHSPDSAPKKIRPLLKYSLGSLVISGASKGDDKASDANANGASALDEQEDSPAAEAPTENDKILSLLTREEGPSLDELIASTGSQRHTTRATLTGLRKKGHRLERAKVDGVSRYTVTASQ